MATKHSSSTVRALTKSVFGKKHIAFGRILDHWTDIIGKDLSEKTQPKAVRYRKDKNKQMVAVLVIDSDSADAIHISYQKLLILERINQLIKKPRFIDIIIEHQPIAHKVSDKTTKQETFRAETPLPENITTMIEAIEDDVLRETLNRYITSANR